MSSRRSDNGEDRISNLSDDILSKILSLLPDTKYAVRTSVLSKRWIRLWTTLPVLSFSYPDSDCDEDYTDLEQFRRFAGNVVSGNVSPNIEKFRLVYLNRYEEHLIIPINDWVQTVVQCGLVELDLDFNCDNDACDCENVGLWISDCFSIQVLKLRLSLNIPLRMSSFQCFTNLKKFEVELEWAHDELTSKLFSSLPKLEELRIKMCFGMGECSNFNIIAPILKKFDFILQDWGDDWDDEELELIKVATDAPLLEYVYLDDDFFSSYTFAKKIIACC